MKVKNENKKSLRINEASEYMTETYDEVYHYNTIYEWLKSGKLKGFKRGGQWRVDKASIDKFFRPESE